MAGCGRAIRADHLMCLEHWGMVPTSTQGHVLLATRALRRSPRDLDTVKRYRAIADDATATVEAKLVRRAAARAGPNEPLDL